MPSTLKTLMEGVSAIHHGNFSTAIKLLEEFCQNYETDSEGNYSEYIYAQQHIVKAYSRIGDKAQAIQRTKELAINGHPQVQKWAKRVLADLSPEAYQSLPQEVIESHNQPFWDSESTNMILRSLNEYLEFGSNSHVVETLETACECLKFNTKEHFYAQVLLIEAYQVNGQLKNAVALCNQVLDSKHYVTRLLANHYLSSFSNNQSVKKLNVEEDEDARVIYQQGYNALIDKNYAEAFEIFKKYCESTLPGTREYLQASQFLVHFHQKHGELEQAISVCLKLITTKDKYSHRWARELLFTDLFRESPSENPIEKQNLHLQAENLNKSPVVIENQSEIEIFKPFCLKTLDEFNQFYKEDLLRILKVFEIRRKQALATIIICNITAFTIILFLLQLPPKLLLLINFFPIVLLSIVYLLFYHFAFKSFIYKFDDKIISKIYQFINTNQNLTISSTASQQDINQTFTDLHHSQLLNGLLKPNYIEQNHLIYGNINNTQIKFSTVNINSGTNYPWEKILEKNWQRDVKISVPISSIFAAITLLAFRLLKGIPYVFNRIISGKSIDFQRFQVEILKNKKYNTKIFKGLFFTTKLKNFSNTVTIIRPKILNPDLNLLDYGKKQLIKVENTEFDSLFTVYSEDQIQARYILSTNLMEKLIRFRKKVNRNIYISFVDDMRYIAIEYPEGIFEPNLFKNIVKFAPLRDYFAAIQLMLGIVE